MQKLKNIEFLRVVGCLAIVWLHFSNNTGFGQFAKLSEVYRGFMSISAQGNKAVDLFFILSGVFLVLTSDFAGSTWNFIKKKLIRFYPVTVFAILCFFAASFFCKDMKFTPYENFLTLCNITGTPFSLRPGNLGVYWYVSILLWVSLFIFYCRKHFSAKAVNLTVAVLAFTAYTCIIRERHGSIAGHFQNCGIIFNIALLRGIGGIGLGYFIGQWYKDHAEKLQTLVLPWYTRLLLTAVEIYTLCFVINNMMLHKPSFKNHMIFIACFVILIVTFLLKQGYVSRLLDRDIWVKLSAYTFSIYLTHVFCRNLMLSLLWKNPACRQFLADHPFAAVSGSIIAAMIFGVLVCCLVERPAAKFLKRFTAPKA